jgi:hypothetical protein
MNLIAMTLAGGAWAFLAFVVVALLAAIYGLYTRSGSAINSHPYGDPYGDAPGARIPSTYGNDRSAARRLTRGTR